ncbi:hypothetical protein PoB_002824200 [Plakobranchus ocellatus]|uniref:Uncharacterized protein n=1 Tax=Plakobranchus ocellatus TaxID=259542 RepID=A0AAV4A4F8_9GAST|nr:hypothetical protein PoB_002824200 [Plakobranchus ocellatus]
MSKRITPFASQNTVAITLAADLCTLNFLVTGEDGCFQVMESRFIWGIQMDPSFITSNQIIKEVIVCLKVSTRPYTNMRRILISIVLLASLQKALRNFNPLKPVILR